MGGNFGSINVQGGNIALIQSIAYECVVREIANGWVTAVREDDEDFEWGAAREVAQRVSKAITNTVLSVEYFDNDYVNFSLYRDGEKVGCHIPEAYDDFPRKPGNVKSFASALSLSPEDEKLLHVIFAETDSGTSVGLLESLLGCPIAIDAEDLKEIAVQGDETYASREYFNKYIASKKKESKIKNQTRLVLRSEKEGGHASNAMGPPPHCLPAIYCADQQPYMGHYPVEVFDVDPNGMLQKLFGTDIPGEIGMSLWVNRAYGVIVVECDNKYKELKPDGINLFVKNSIHVFSDDGTVLDRQGPAAHEHIELSHPLLLDDSRFFASGKCYNFRQRCVEWSCGPDMESAHWSTPLILPNGNLLCQYQQLGMREKILCLIEPNGKELKQINLGSSYSHWSQPVLYRDSLINIFGVDVHRPWSDRMVCYDFSMNERWHYDLPNSSAFMGPAIDEDSGILYFQRTPKVTTAFDLEHHEIIAESDDIQGKFRALETFSPGVGLICRRDNTSSIDVLDRDLKLISHHRTKGNIGFFFQRNERLFLLSYQPEEYGLFSITKPGHTYIYELKR